MPAADAIPQLRALRRIRALSWPLLVLISVVLGLAVIVATLTFVALLGHPRFGSLHDFVDFGPIGVGVAIGEIGLARYPGFILVNDLSAGQRFIVAGLAAACWVCNILVLLQLRGLFVLYARGVILSNGNITRIKRFGLWVAITAIVVNVGGRVFVRIMGTPLQGLSNPAFAVIVGAMIYVIGYVTELAREADLERKEFV